MDGAGTLRSCRWKNRLKISRMQLPHWCNKFFVTEIRESKDSDIYQILITTREIAGKRVDQQYWIVGQWLQNSKLDIATSVSADWNDQGSTRMRSEEKATDRRALWTCSLTSTIKKQAWSLTQNQSRAMRSSGNWNWRLQTSTCSLEVSVVIAFWSQI